MYRVQSKRKRGKLWLIILLFSALSIGLGIGYASVKMSILRDRTLAAPSKTPQPIAITPMPQTVAENEPNKAASLNANSYTEENPEFSAKKGYLVKTTEGKVSVFKISTDGTTQFSHTIPVDLGDLPAADREKLEKGIYLENKTELAELAEDYSS